MNEMTSGAHLISEKERAFRQKTVDFARGCVRYEGFILDGQSEDINRRFINGEMTRTEFVKAQLVSAGVPEK